MSDYTQIFDDTVNPMNLIGQTTLSNIRSGISSGVFPNIGVISNNYYYACCLFGSCAQVASLTPAFNNIIYFQPFISLSSNTYKTLGIFIPTSIAGNINLCIYNSSTSSDSRPTGLPISGTTSGSMSTAPAGTKEFTFSSPITFSAGLYWMALMTSSSINLLSPALAATNNTQIEFGLQTSIDSSSASAQNMATGFNANFTYSTTFPNINTLTLNTQITDGSTNYNYLMYMIAN